MIQKKKVLEHRIAQLLSETIIEEGLPLQITIGRASQGMTQVLIEYNPEDEYIYQNLMNQIIEALYP